MPPFEYQSFHYTFSSFSQGTPVLTTDGQLGNELGTSAQPSGCISTRFGRRLSQLRHSRQLTQAQLADFLGMDRSFISDLERGKKSISLSYLDTIARRFNLTLEQLLLDI